MAKKSTFKVKVNFPMFVTVEAEDEDEARDLALNEASRILDTSTINPEVESIYEATED